MNILMMSLVGATISLSAVSEPVVSESACIGDVVRVAQLQKQIGRRICEAGEDLTEEVLSLCMDYENQTVLFEALKNLLRIDFVGSYFARQRAIVYSLLGQFGAEKGGDSALQSVELLSDHVYGEYAEGAAFLSPTLDALNEIAVVYGAEKIAECSAAEDNYLDDESDEDSFRESYKSAISQLHAAVLRAKSGNVSAVASSS